MKSYRISALLCVTLLGLLVIATIYKAPPVIVTPIQIQDQNIPISDDEKAAMVAGLLIGLNMTMAFSPENLIEINRDLQSLLAPCTTIRCVTGRLATLDRQFQAQRTPEIIQ